MSAHSERRTLAKDMLREIGEAITPDYDPYEGNFAEWKDVVREFSIRDPNEQKEPDEVYYACYETPSYEGYAHVFFRRGRTYFWASGSHCSCHGLEDQWEPVSYEDKQLFIDCLKRHYSSKDWEEKVVARLG